MRYFPSNRIMLITIILVTLGFGIKFVKSSTQQFFQLNFDWDKEEPIKELGTAILDSVSYNYVKLRNNTFSPNPQNTYKLSGKKGNFYFRYVYSLKDDSIIEFKGVEWITDIPESTGIEYSIDEVLLPLKNGNGPSVVTIGDGLLIENEAKYFRKDLAKLFSVSFKGTYYDVFDFPHMAITTNTSSIILAQINNVPQADNYVLMYGSNEHLDSLQTFQSNTEEILKNLQAKKPKNIILITLPPSKDAVLNNRNKEINNVFLKLSNAANVKIINTFQLFSGNLEKYIRKDGINISRDGYYELAKQTAKLIK